MIHFLAAEVHDDDASVKSAKDDKMMEEVEEEGIGWDKLIDVQSSNPIHIPARSSDDSGKND